MNDERPLTLWERRVIEVLAAVDRHWAPKVRESIPHLVWTSGCRCGCSTFSVRDERQPRRLRTPSYFSVGSSPSEPNVSFWLQVDAFGHVTSVDMDNILGQFPDPITIVVSKATPER